MTDTPKPEDARREQPLWDESFEGMRHLVDAFRYGVRSDIHALRITLAMMKHHLEERPAPHAPEQHARLTLIDEAQETCTGIYVFLDELASKARQVHERNAVWTLMSSTAVELLGRLRPLRSRLKRLSGHLGGEVKWRRHMKRGFNGVRRVHGLCRDLRYLGYVQPESPQPVYVEECLAEALRLTRDTLTRTARTEEDFTAELPPVLGSAGHLLRVFLLLLRGAAQTLSQRPSRQHVLRLWTQREDGWVRVNFSSTSTELPAETLASVPAAGRVPRVWATPLPYALSISRAIVRGMGGGLRFKGEEDSDMICCVRLPAAPALPNP